jgi:hypothetical protein
LSLDAMALRDPPRSFRDDLSKRELLQTRSVIGVSGSRQEP